PPSPRERSSARSSDLVTWWAFSRPPRAESPAHLRRTRIRPSDLDLRPGPRERIEIRGADSSSGSPDTAQPLRPQPSHPNRGRATRPARPYGTDSAGRALDHRFRAGGIEHRVRQELADLGHTPQESVGLVVGLRHLARLLGVDTPLEQLHLPGDPVLVPAEHLGHQFGHLAGAVDATVLILHRDPRATHEDV